MTPDSVLPRSFTAMALALSIGCSHADLISPVDDSVPPTFDIVDAHAHDHTDAPLVTFMMETVGTAGSVIPESVGQLAGAGVHAYVWPTSLDPAVVGFDPGSGILAMAITAHPDFDDTPLFDENADGDPANDGAGWHSHWVVLSKNERCDAGLAVRDVSPGVDALPATAPRLPIALDSPGMSPVLNASKASVTVPVAERDGLHFDAVTARLRVRTDENNPLLCVEAVHDIASGDLSLPGTLTLLDGQ